MNLVRYGFLLVAFPTMVTSIPLPPTISLMQPQGIRFVIPGKDSIYNLEQKNRQEEREWIHSVDFSPFRVDCLQSSHSRQTPKFP